mgnify:CR=1 FL=1
MKTVILLFCFLHFCSSGRAESTSFVVGVEDLSYYPLFDFGRGGESYTKELLDEFGRQYDYKLTYLPLPIKRFDRWLLDDQIDFKYPDNARWYPNNKAPESFIFSNSTVRLVAGTITPVTKEYTRKNLKVLGTLLGFYPTQWVDQIKNKEVTLFESSSTLVLLQQVLRGQVDGVDIEPSVVAHYLSVIGKPGALQINKNFSYEVYDYFLSTIKHQNVIEEFNQFLVKNKAFIEKLRKKYNIFDHRPYEAKSAQKSPN